MAKKSTALAIPELAGLPDALRDAMSARMAKLKEEQAKMPGGGAKAVSFKNGTITFAGEPVGTKMDAVILASQYERVFYDRAYDPDNPSPPVCYSRDGEAPHADSHDKQAEKCKTCPHNRFGSADNGKGKACRETVRLSLIPTDVLLKPDLAATDVYSAKIPVTSVKTYKDYASVLMNKGISTEAVVTTISVTPDPKTQFALGFRAKSGIKIAPKNVQDYIALHSRADELLQEPYPAPRDDAPAPRKKIAKKVRKSRM